MRPRTIEAQELLHATVKSQGISQRMHGPGFALATAHTEATSRHILRGTFTP